MSTHKQVYLPSHPKASASGMVYEHVVIAEKALGKALPQKAHVHHVDGNPRNNVNSNLVICQDMAYHKLLHYRANVIAKGGDPSREAFCGSCRSFRPFEAFGKSRENKSTGLHRWCRKCERDNQRERKQLARQRFAVVQP